MKDYVHLCLDSKGSVADAARILDQGVPKICLVVEEGKLLGTITDGDIRRGLLSGVLFDAPAIQVMNANPRTAQEDSNLDAVKPMMTALGIHVPLLDGDGRLTGLLTLDELAHDDRPHDNWVVLMAGGLGERLRPLTNTTPKPLLQVGDKPLLQSILENFIQQNFSKFYIAVNYQSEAIKQHFGDGSEWGVTIRYIEEPHRMGTAGALTLLPELPTTPVIVMNGDLVTRVSFQDLLDFHAEQEAKATMCVREYDFQVPFGVISLEGHRIMSIDEKPLHHFFVNAGIYVLDPDVIARIPEGERHDMTQVFEGIITAGEETAAFPVHEYWLDIGRIDDLERAKSDFVAEQSK
ncbi:MAG: nucleotidyltransferase family protein [Rhodospirillales bacterium]|nr:nucleotidyltransferase family protein [Rhodospirillales bacterium]MBO6787741.1 nucleotidyltransferase family protein [Rhodospirillales bacterium]